MKVSTDVASYLVLQGLPTTITLTLGDATALRTFPCHVQNQDLKQQLTSMSKK